MRKFLFLVVIGAVLAVTHVFWAPQFAKFLTVEDNIRKADCAIVLSGDPKFEREHKALELYRDGYVNKVIRILEKDNVNFNTMAILLNSVVTQKEAYTRYFELNGVSADSLIIGDMVATSTFDELSAAKNIVLKMGYHSVVIVTSDYHMRRALMTARWIFKDTDVNVYNATIFSDDFHPDRWWLNEGDTRSVLFEYPCLVFYLVYHFFLGK